MSVTRDTPLWHPFADMGAVRHAEFVIERGEDVWVWDTEGRRYLDATASLWYANVGHGRTEIADAIAAQLAKIEAYSAFGDFANPPALELAGILAGHAPVSGARVFLGSGGGDAVDTAAKLARRYWAELGHPERAVLLSRHAGYHGTHGFGTAIAGIPANREGFGEIAENERVAHDDLGDVRATIERIGADRIAAIFVEPVIGAGGVYPPPEGYLEGVAELCAQTGILFIADSVICGFGRLGTWFGIERWGVDADMIIFAKGVTSGYLPLGGVVVSGQIAEPFWGEAGGPIFRHDATYAGHATCCAAALANLAILEREGLITRGQENERAMFDAIAPFADLDAVGEVRGGVGMMAAVELSDELLAADPKALGTVVMAAREAGVLIRPLAKAVAISPPLTATQEHFALIAQAIEHGLSAAAPAALR
jgi:putrescine---pyruvate transaminase